STIQSSSYYRARAFSTFSRLRPLFGRMTIWAKQVAVAVLVLAFALAVGRFVMVLRAQQAALAPTMAAAHIRAVSPADGASNVPLSGEIRADYVSRPTQDPTVKLEPPVA